MEITVKGNKIKLVKDYLTNGEVNYIVSEVLKIYDNPGDVDGYNYSPLAMLTNFYALLFGFCIEGYEIESSDDYNKYYNIGTQYELLRVVTNAEEAYHLVMSLSKEIVGIENVIERKLGHFIDNILEKIPDPKSMNKLANKIPKEWQKVFNEYNAITGNKNEEDK